MEPVLSRGSLETVFANTTSDGSDVEFQTLTKARGLRPSLPMVAQRSRLRHSFRSTASYARRWPASISVAMKRVIAERAHPAGETRSSTS